MKTIDQETIDLLNAIHTALSVPRNRMGRLTIDLAAAEPLRQLAIVYDAKGATDTPDQVCKVIEGFLKRARTHKDIQSE